MRKSKHNLKITHTFANGTTITNEEFQAIVEREGGFYIDPELNKEWYQEAQRVLDPNYATRERQRRRIMRTGQRRAELAEEAKRIAEQLSEI